MARDSVVAEANRKPDQEGTREVNAINAVERVQVMGGDRQVVSHVGLHLLGDLADRVGLSSAYSAAVPWAGERPPGHDRGRLLAQVAVMMAGGGECVADMATLRDQPELFGDVGSAPTIWRALHGVDGAVQGPGRRQGNGVGDQRVR